ncbi:MAG TPA: FliH/SctL family protein [Lachnospiraceae bacterium]|nr:FliH/SctL family protein [Lachnospiraceae bacterium]
MSNLVKSNYISYDEEQGARVIDSNKLIEERIQQLAMAVADEENDESFEAEFVEGLDSEQVEMLLADNDAEEGDDANVIRQQAPPQPQVDTAAIENEANARAEEIVSQAKEEAKSIIDHAIAEAEGIKNQAKQEGHAEGYEQGSAECAEKNAELEAKLRAEKQQLEEDYEARLAELEPMFVNTLTDIYEHVFHVQFAENKEVVLHLLQDAIRKIEGSKDFIVRVSKADYEYVSERKKELLSKTGNAGNVEVIEDVTLEVGHCMVETDGGIFDCGVDTQLDGLKKELKLLSYTKE